MKNITFLLFILLSQVLNSQDTFSIIAVDTITGEIGSAGASCIDETQIEGGALIISDVIPGRGAIHTQSYWNPTNQQNAHARMVEGMSPLEIIDWLSTHDAQNNPTVRQYGIVDFDTLGHARSAGFTGANCLNYKNHITGPNYAIQGNILLGQQILDSIEARFLNTEGSFAEKMMAALQGAKVIGADTRCTENGTSSLSAFIRVARPADTAGGFYCDLNVPSLPAGMEPIDSLQTLFNEWLGTVVGLKESRPESELLIYPNPASTYFIVDSRQLTVGSQQSLKIVIYNMLGEKIREVRTEEKETWRVKIDVSGYQPGIYFVTVLDKSAPVLTRELIIIK
ncbi:MAG: DUF1028 domain-containing protein [Bacteroidales bacterium]|nr:DUF1028 domain-containing protein [Bacteroidales bacterium]